MKKITLLLSFVTCAMFAGAQITVFNETCGQDGASASPRPAVSTYTGWDNKAPITFTNTTERYPDLRKTSTMDSHVWFAATYETDFLISNIPASGFDNLKLSFDLASNKGTPSEANINKIKVYVNDVEVAMPSVSIPEQNKYINSGAISIQSSSTIKLRFLFTAANNPTDYGYRLDNIKIVGQSVSALNTPNAQKLEVLVSGKNLLVKNVAEGAEVEIFSAVGSKVQTSAVENGKVSIANLKGGMYVVRSGKLTQKIML